MWCSNLLHFIFHRSLQGAHCIAAFLLSSQSQIVDSFCRMWIIISFSILSNQWKLWAIDVPSIVCFFNSFSFLKFIVDETKKYLLIDKILFDIASVILLISSSYLSDWSMDSNKKQFSIFGNYQLPSTNYEVPGELFVSASGIGCLYRFALVHSTPGSNAISPYLNFDPKILNSVRDANERRMESEEEQHV